MKPHGTPSSHVAARATSLQAEAGTRAAAIPIRVLILEDSPSDAELMVDALRRAGFDPRWERVTTQAEFVSRLEPEPDLILSDYGLPGFTGLEAVRLARARGLDVPFILVSGSIGESIAVEVMREGADDYLLKDRMARLGQAAIQALEKKKLRDEMRRTERAMQESEERFRAAFEQAGVGMALRGIDPRNSRWLRVNQKLCDILGYTRDELLQLTSLDITPPEDRDLAIDYNEKLLKGEITSYSREKRYVRKDGRIFWANISLSAVRGPDGRPSHIISVIEDITERKEAEAALSRSEARFRSITQHLPGRVSLRDLEGRYVFVNHPWLRAFGMTEAAVLGHTPEEIFSQERAAALRSVHDEVLESSLPVSRTLKVESTGAPQWWLATHFPIPDADGKAVMVGTVSLDITERKTYEEKLTRLSRIRAVSGEINAAIVRSGTKQQLFHEACHIAVEHGGFGIAWAGTLDALTLDITPVASAGLEAEEFLGGLRSSALSTHPQGQGVAGRAVRERRLVVENDLMAEGTTGKRRQEAVRRGYQSRIALPLLAESAVIGVLVLYAREKDFFTEEELKLLGELASNVSYAVEHIDRQEKIEKLSRVRAMTSEINAAIVRARNRQELHYEACRIAVEHGQFGMAWIGELDAKLEVRPVASVGMEESGFLLRTVLSVRPDLPHGQGVLPRAVRERRPVFNNDITVDSEVGGERRKEAVRRGYRSVIVLPLTVEDAVVGTFSMFAKELNYFDNEEVKLLTELAGNLSFALEHMATQAKIEKLSRIRAISSEVNAAIIRAREQGALLEETCRIASEQGKFDMIWIGTINHEKQEVRPVAWRGFSTEAAHAVSWATISSAKGTLGEAMHTRRAAFRDDIEKQLPAGKLRQEALAKGCHSTVCLPLVVDDKVVTLVTLFAPGRGFFNEDELALLNEVASNISFALEGIARQEKIERLSRIRAVSSEINAAGVRIRDRVVLLRETCRIAAEYGKFEFVWVALFDEEKHRIQPVAWTGFSAETAQAVNWTTISAPGVMLGEVIRTRRLAVRNDLESEQPTGILRQAAARKGCRSAICLPFLVDDKLVAVAILFAVGRYFFVEDELALLEETVSNVSFALESIARQEKIERLSRIRAVSSQINAAIVRIRDRQELFDEACRIAVEAGRFPFVWLGIVDRDAKQLKPVAWAGEEGGFLGTMQSRRSLEEAPPQGHGPASRAVLEKRAVVVNDIQNDPRILRKQEHLERNIHSVAMLPLLVSDEAVGVLALHAREIGFFDEEEVKMLSGLAGDIAFALDHIEKAEKLEYLSYYDTVTGLPNRSLFMDRAGQQMRSRGGEPLMVAVILVNLERFRNINETFGRQGGDTLLKLVAHRLEAAFHGKDYLARVGADNFGVVMRGVREAATVVHAVENQILACFHDPFRLRETEVRIAARVGVAMFPADGAEADTLFANAEAALKNARASGERFLFYSANMNARAAQVVSLETRLRKAVEGREFVLHYQPKIELTTGAICGLEALLRWQEPGGGLISPGAFIPVLEETGLILEVGKWALGHALSQHRDWQSQGCPAPRIAVNVSAIQLQQPGFADMVIEAVQEQGDYPDALELEVTESLLMKDVQSSIRKLSTLRGIGIYIAMDDFGTGYSSLSYIGRLPISSVKIDRSFITGLASNPQDMAIVTTIIALAHSLNLRVVAEGVETEDQSKLLKLLKCDEAQGYLFSKPLPAAEIEPLLRAGAQPAH